MKIGSSAPIRKPIPLTPLVDIVFLLLMFFMLSSTFTKFGLLDASAGVAAPSSIPAEQKFPGAVAVVNNANDVSINGMHLSPAALAAKLEELQKRGVTRIVLRAGKDAAVQDFVTALEIIKAAGFADLAVAQ